MSPYLAAQAYNELGQYYKVASPPNYEFAAEWFRRAAEAGSAQGQRALGWAYYSGQGVSVDMVTGASWIEKAAEQGLPEAEGDIGLMYADGRGVVQNWRKAYIWITLAAHSGHVTAIKDQSIAESHLPYAQVLDAKAEIAAIETQRTQNAQVKSAQ